MTHENVRINIQVKSEAYKVWKEQKYARVPNWISNPITADIRSQTHLNQLNINMPGMGS